MLEIKHLKLFFSGKISSCLRKRQSGLAIAYKVQGVWQQLFLSMETFFFAFVAAAGPYSPNKEGAWQGVCPITLQVCPSSIFSNISSA